MEPSFVIVIVLYNSAEWIGPCLDAVRAMSYRNYQVWAVDNDSRDDGADYVAQSYPSVKLVRSRWNRGFAGGNNHAIEVGPQSDFVLLLNPDTEIAPDALTKLAEAFKADPKLGVAGCKILYPGARKLQHAGGGFTANALPYHIGDGEMDRGQYKGVIECEYVQGAAMAVRRGLWDALHGFDEGFNPAYFEEADFCRRARKAGWKVAAIMDAEVIHHQDPAKQVASQTFLKLLFRGRARYALKHLTRREWVFKFWPAELRWLASRQSKGHRRIAVKALWNAACGAKDEFS